MGLSEDFSGLAADIPFAAQDQMLQPASGPAEMGARYSGSVEDSIKLLLDLVTNRQFPQRLQAFYSAIPGVQRKANASPMAVQQSVAPQMSQLATTLQRISAGLSKQLGPFGGGQIHSGMQKAIGGIGQQATQLLTQPVTDAIETIRKMAGTSVAFGSNQEQTGTKPGQFDANGFALMLQGLKEFGPASERLWPSTPTPSFGGMGYSPPTFTGDPFVGGQF